MDARRKVPGEKEDRNKAGERVAGAAWQRQRGACNFECCLQFLRAHSKKGWLYWLGLGAPIAKVLARLKGRRVQSLKLFFNSTFFAVSVTSEFCWLLDTHHLRKQACRRQETCHAMCFLRREELSFKRRRYLILFLFHIVGCYNGRSHANHLQFHWVGPSMIGIVGVRVGSGFGHFFNPRLDMRRELGG